MINYSQTDIEYSLNRISKEVGKLVEKNNQLKMKLKETEKRRLDLARAYAQCKGVLRNSREEKKE